MRADIYWVAGVPKGWLAVLPRPRGGDWLADEVESLARAGVDVLVCLLTKEEVSELDLAKEAGCCAANEIEFVSFPIADRDAPSRTEETRSFLRRLVTLLNGGKSVAVHCRQGVGRTALVAACVLALLGDTPDAAFERIARARGCPVPDTPEQRDWVKKFVTGEGRTWEPPNW